MVSTSRTLSSSKLVITASQRKQLPLIGIQRLQSTSTMDLVTLDEKGNRRGTMRSTISSNSGERDYSAMARNRRRGDKLIDWESMQGILEQYNRIENAPYFSEELDLIQAAERRHSYDKVLFLLNNGENVCDFFSENDEDAADVMKDTLTGKGCGQALSLSRRVATFCNNETGLIPELFVMEPSRKAAQTAFLSFPYDTPFHSLRRTQWICHPAIVSDVPLDDQTLPIKLQREFSGVDCSLLRPSNQTTIGSFSNDEVTERVDELLTWIRDRDEKIVVISCGAKFLESLGRTLEYDGSNCIFSSAELRAVGVRFN